MAPRETKFIYLIMARFDQLENMNDVAVKPPMLRSLIRQYVPDEKHPLSLNNSCFELPKLVSILQTYRLLSESHTHSLDQKLINSWKSAVDDWVNRLELLLSSDMVYFNSFFDYLNVSFSCLKRVVSDNFNFLFFFYFTYSF